MLPPKEGGRLSALGSAMSSAASSPPNMASGAAADGAGRNVVSAASTAHVDEDTGESAFVHMEIQLYKLENNFYLVDFKCAGYEQIWDNDDDEDGYSDSMGSGDGDGDEEDEYEFDDGIPEPGYVPEDEDDDVPMAATTPEGEQKKRELVVTNPDPPSPMEEGTVTADLAPALASGEGKKTKAKTVGFAEDGEDVGGVPEAG